MVNSKHPTNQELFYTGLFGKAKKLLSSNNDGGSESNCAKIDTVPTFFVKRDDDKTSEKPTFHEVKEEERYTDCGLPLSEMVAMFARKARSAYERVLISEHGVELLAKADEYEIPYDASNIDCLDLQDKVEEFEEAITKANEYGIDWKNFGYDLLGIEQEIIDLEEAERDYVSYAMGEYNLNRSVEA